MKTTRTVTLLLAVAVAAGACKFLARQIVPHVERWANGLTKREGRLDAGLQTGDWTYYFESGQRRAQGHYENDHQVGPWTYYFENGGVEWTGAFDTGGKRTGEWTFYYADSTMRARGRYIGDFEDGAWEFFATDGALERTGQYDGGKMSGPWRYLQAGGKPKAEGLCLRGQRIGPWKIWDESGKEGGQDFGTRPGITLALEKWPNGERRRTGVLQNGAPVGRWTSWHDNGQQRFCCTLTGAAASGVFDARDKDGNVLAQGVLANGQFGEGSIAVEGGKTRPIAAGPLPTVEALTAEWATAELLATLAPEQAVATLGGEVAAAIDPAARVEPVAAAQATAGTAAVVAGIESQPERIPAPVQPSFTVNQDKEREDYVQNYIGGPSASRPSIRKYAPVATPPGSAPVGNGRRPEMEGKPLAIDRLQCVDGSEVDLKQYLGKKRVLLVILRGFLGEVCVYCVAQTEALARCREDLEKLNIEVLVLYPGAKENEQCFEQAYAMTFGKGAPPYRVFYDPDLEVVQKLGVSGDLAYPTTIIVDEKGIVQYAYTGANRADRPAAKELIRVIKGMKQ